MAIGSRSDNLLLVSDEEVLLGRQIRFSLPLDEQQDEKSTPEDVLLPPILRFV
jgi:hypothetical protein